MRRLPALIALSAACALGTGLSTGCTETKQGEIVLAFQTDMKVPEDVSVVALQVKVAGVVKFSQSYAVGPSGVKLPSTIALVDPTNKAITVSVRLVGLTASKPRTLRDVVTTIPPKRSALLRLGIQYLCTDGASIKGSPTTTPDEAANVVESVCSADQTCIAGTCADARVDSASLPDYVAADVFGGGDETGGGTCFDVTGCFAGAQPAQVDTGCTIAAPADLSRTNVAIRLPPGSDGVCDQTACWVVLDAESTSGWVPQGGRLKLPDAVCKKTMAVDVSSRCAQKTEKIPTCGPWSSVTGSAETPDGGAPPPVDGGPDGPPVRLPAKLLYQGPMDILGNAVIAGQTLFFFTNGSLGATVRSCTLPDCSPIKVITQMQPAQLLIAASTTNVAFSPVGAFDLVQSCADVTACTPVPMFPSDRGVRGLAANAAGVSAIREYMGNTTVELCNDWVMGCPSGTVVTTLPFGALANDLVVDPNGVRYWIDDQSGGRIARCTTPSCPTPTALKTGIGASDQLHLTANVLSWVDATGQLWDCDESNCAGQTLASNVDGYAPGPGGHVIYRAGMPGTLAWLRVMDKTEVPLPAPVGQVSAAAVDAVGNYYVVARTASDVQIWRYPLP